MIFTDNKYTRCYFSIVNRALSRVVGDMYVEKHHIIPKSLGGSNNKSNFIISSIPLERFNAKNNIDSLFKQVFVNELGF